MAKTCRKSKGAKASSMMRKWAWHSEWVYWRQGLTNDQVLRIVKVSERTLFDWDRGRKPIPHWAPELLRFRLIERRLDVQRMTHEEILQAKGITHVDPANWVDVGQIAA